MLPECPDSASIHALAKPYTARSANLMLGQGLKKFKVPLLTSSTTCRCLQENQMGGDEYISKMDQQLPEATILLFRRLAHAKVTNLLLLTLPQLSCFLDMLPSCARMGFPHSASHTASIKVYKYHHKPCVKLQAAQCHANTNWLTG